MRPGWYGGAAIKGTKEQYEEILSTVFFQKDDGKTSIEGGLWRIRKGQLILEMEGWGTEMECIWEAIGKAQKLGCEVRYLMLNMTEDREPEGSAAPMDWKEIWEVKGFCVTMKPGYEFNCPPSDDNDWDLHFEYEPENNSENEVEN